MNPISKKRILLLITNSYAATNIIHSGLIKPLAEEFEIYILSNLIGDNELAQINHHFKICTSRINVSVPAETRLMKLLRHLQKFIFFHYFRIETQKIKDEQNAYLYNLFANSIVNFIRFTGYSKSLLKILRNKIIQLTEKNNSLNELITFQFSGVISSSPLDIRENIIVNYLKKEGVPSLAIIISWDNLTSKGIINADHDYVQVWNQFMADEYRKFYSVFETTGPEIRIAGVPRFDIYFKERTYCKSAFRVAYQLPASAKIILFATSAAIHFPQQREILQHLTDYAAQKKNITILVRCHAGDDFEQYQNLGSKPFVKIWLPEKFVKTESISSWLPGLDMLQNLAEMMHHCDVCIQVASTLRLEAAICNKPLISIAYDGDRSLPFNRSVKRFYYYSHQLPLNQLDIDHMVFNKQELFETLNKTLYQSESVNNLEKIRSFIQQDSPSAVHSTMTGIRKWLT